MGNCAQRLTGRRVEGTTMLDVGMPSTSIQVTNFHIGWGRIELDCRACGIADVQSAVIARTQKSEYFSPRAEEMMQSKSQFSSVAEYEIEHSKVHWSEKISPSSLSTSSEPLDCEELDPGNEELDRENAAVFAEFQNNPHWINDEWGNFFAPWPHRVKLGHKIAEGAQGAIFEVIGLDGGNNASNKFLFKVFKKGYRVLDLKKQWPNGIFQKQRSLYCFITHGFLLEDGRFAFMMARLWGDLRKLIERAIQEKNNQGPPFPYEWNGKTISALYFVMGIANHMRILHESGILHRDLKASNVLLRWEGDQLGVFAADFESSIGVIGTGLWRAPEVLLALNERRAIDFSEKVDVYSFGITCFEIVTGHLPFETQLVDCRASYNLVIEGRRPILPSDLDLTLKQLIESCWNPIPDERPSFSKICDTLKTF